MTHRKTPQSAAEILNDLCAIARHPGSDAQLRVSAVRLAFEAGKSEGHLEGARSMGERMLASIDKSLDKLLPAKGGTER